MTPEEIEKKAKDAEIAAAKAKAKLDKPLPSLAAPTVSLPEEIRTAVAKRCRATDVSFSVQSSMMWLELLKKEGLVKPSLEIDFTKQRTGVSYKKVVAEKDEEIAKLQKQIADLKATKK